MKHHQIVAINILIFLLLVAPPIPLHAQNDQLGVGGAPQETPEMEGNMHTGRTIQAAKRKKGTTTALIP